MSDVSGVVKDTTDWCGAPLTILSSPAEIGPAWPAILNMEELSSSDGQQSGVHVHCPVSAPAAVSYSGCSYKSQLSGVTLNTEYWFCIFPLVTPGRVKVPCLILSWSCKVKFSVLRSSWTWDLRPESDISLFDLLTWSTMGGGGQSRMLTWLLYWLSDMGLYTYTICYI